MKNSYVPPGRRRKKNSINPVYDEKGRVVLSRSGEILSHNSGNSQNKTYSKVYAKECIENIKSILD